MLCVCATAPSTNTKEPKEAVKGVNANTATCTSGCPELNPYLEWV